MRVYYDSSALVKLLVDEPGSQWTRDCWKELPGHCSSRLAYVETRAALARAKSANRLSVLAYRQLIGDFESLWRRLELVEADSAVVNIAGALAEEFGLRGYDAVHLSSALFLDETRETVMLTWDSNLADATAGAGIPVIRTTDA